MLEDILKSSLAHPRSYLVRGEKENILPALFGAVEKEWGLVVQGSPDVMSVDGHMNVEEARGLLDFASMSPFAENGLKIIILSAERVTREAQNTLLKLTEEPSASLRIFVIVPNDVELLPTLLSRLEDISQAFEKGGSTAKTDAGNFLAMGLKERFKLAEKISKDEDETTMDVFLRDLEKKIHPLTKKIGAGASKQMLEAIVFAKEAAGSQSRPKRMILEALAISLPVL